MKKNKHATGRFYLLLAGAFLGVAILACSSGSAIPLPTDTPIPTATSLPAPTSTSTQAPTATLQSDLAGYWQIGEVVFTIQKQNDKYVVTAITTASTSASTRTLNSQSWDGSSLTWTYTFSEVHYSFSVTYKTRALNGDSLTADYSTSDGGSMVRILRKVPAATPAYYDLPYTDDFSNPASGWDIYDAKPDGAGYKDGSYFVISRSNQFTSYGEANRFYGDTLMSVDATPVSGPAGNNFSYHIGCRIQSNGDGYLFEVRADGYFAVDYYTGGGAVRTDLTKNQWQKSDAILPGLVTNHLTVTCAGSELKLDVNGQVLYDGHDTTFTEGDLDLGSGTYDRNNTPAEIYFDNLSVNMP